MALALSQTMLVWALSGDLWFGRRELLITGRLFSHKNRIKHVVTPSEPSELPTRSVVLRAATTGPRFGPPNVRISPIRSPLLRRSSRVPHSGGLLVVTACQAATAIKLGFVKTIAISTWFSLGLSKCFRYLKLRIESHQAAH